MTTDFIDLKVNGISLRYNTFDGVIINRNVPRHDAKALVSALNTIFDLEDGLDAIVRLNETYSMYATINGAGAFDIQATANLYQYVAEGILEIDDTYREILRDCIAIVSSRNTKKPLRIGDKSGFVYLVQSPTGAYKIGRTSNPANRLKTFSVKLPFEVEYVAVIQSQDMYSLESELHNMFAGKRINGEWFNLEPVDVDYIKSLAVGNE